MKNVINKHKSNKIKENSNTVRHLNNGTDRRHSKSCCDQSSPARRTTRTNKPVSGRNVTASFHEWHPSYSEQHAVLPHPVRFFHVLIFYFRKQIIIWRMYGVIADFFTFHWTTRMYVNLLHFPIPTSVYMPPIRPAILQDVGNVTRCYHIRFPAVRFILWVPSFFS